MAWEGVEQFQQFIRLAWIEGLERFESEEKPENKFAFFHYLIDPAPQFIEVITGRGEGIF